MNYLKFFNTGGKVVKFLTPSGPITKEIADIALIGEFAAKWHIDGQTAKSLIEDFGIDQANKTMEQNQIAATDDKKHQVNLELLDVKDVEGNATGKQIGQSALTAVRAASGLVGAAGGTTGMLGTTAFNSGLDAALQGDKKGAAAGIVGGVAMQAMGVVDQATMGDKNFSASSKAIDTGVHAVSGALMKSGNPWAMGAGAILEGVNFATKLFGKTVQGYDVNIENSGYGNLGHMESESGRVWNNMSGKLAKRNELARMALAAADISEDQKFEQEARTNSVSDVLRQNQVALAGGIDTSLLAAKKGAKLQRLEEYRKNPRVKRAKEGTKLEKVELSEGGNIIPTGELHKNKHDLDLEHITLKGVPVVTVDNDSAETFTEIKQQEDSITQHAEIEAGEVILNKSLTDYVEELRKKWYESDEKDSDILLEVGKRLTKELLFNTEDKDKIIGQQEEKL